MSTSAPLERASGSDRYATAACLSRLAYPDGAASVVLARGDAAGGLADALAGTVLAAAVDGPVLLTDPGYLPSATMDEIDRLGPSDVLVLGGTDAISPDVVDDLTDAGYEVERVYGPGRADTAAAIAERAGADGPAFVVNGWRPADALVAGATAARQGAALLLATPAGLPDVTVEALRGRPSAVVVGGHGVVNAATETAVRALVPETRRIAGASRYETAASIARAFPAAGTIHLVAAADDHLVDAIGASWLAARPGGGPVLYADEGAPGHGTDRWLRLGGLDDRPTIRLVGGAGVLAPTLVDVLEDRYDEAAAGGPPAEMRAFWVHAFDPSLKTRAGIERMLNAATRANLNTVIVQGARRHDAYYTSSVLPRTPDPDLAEDLDVLEVLVDAAHARGLEVHAWFATMPTYHPVYDDLEMPAGHVYREHGPDSNDTWLTTENVGDYAYLDPGIPAVQDHVAEMIREVVERYDVDGIHLDYQRYASPDAGYHPTSVDRFEQQDGTDFDAWRRRQVTDLTRRVFLEVAEADPTVLVSLAAIAQGDGPGPDRDGFRESRAYAEKFQDWASWVEEGLIDVVYPMAYFREPSHASWYDHWVSFVGTLDTDRTAAIGQAAFLNSVPNSLSQVDEALAATDGIGLYSYQSDVSDAPQGTLLAELARTRFADPASPPATSWRDDPTAGHVLVETTDGRTVTLRSTSGATRTVVADATGTAGFVWLAPGRWTVETAGRTPTTVEVRAGEVSRVTLG